MFFLGSRSCSSSLLVVVGLVLLFSAVQSMDDTPTAVGDAMSSIPSPSAPSSSSSSSSGTEVLERLMVVHRHGARTALLMCPNCSSLAGGPTGAGVLTTQGKIMLNQLGRYVQSHYPSVVPLPEYAYRQTYTKSADVGRCIQSADSFLRGLYNCSTSDGGVNGDGGGKNRSNDTSSMTAPPTSHTTTAPVGCTGPNSILFPVVRTVEKKNDLWLDTWGGMPGLNLRYHTQEPHKYVFMDAVVQKVWSNDTMRRLGLETGFGSECPENPYNCAGDAIDFAWALEAEGKLDQYPFLKSLLPEATLLWFVGNNYTYNGPMQLHDNFFENFGTQGFPLASTLTQWAAAGEKNNKKPVDLNQPHITNPSLVHFSGHDVTLMPLAKTLGNDTLLLPPFGAALLFEVFSHNTSSSNVSTNTHYSSPNHSSDSSHEKEHKTESGRWVRAIYGSPKETPSSGGGDDGGNHLYTMEPFAVKCLAADGVTVYSSLDGPPPPQDQIGDNPAEGRRPLPRTTAPATNKKDTKANNVGCPLLDWRRYVDTRGPSSDVTSRYGHYLSSDPYCYALPSDLEAINCTPTDVVLIPPPPAAAAGSSDYARTIESNPCLKFRSRCPMTACRSPLGGGSEESSSLQLLPNFTACVPVARQTQPPPPTTAAPTDHKGGSKNCTGTNDSHYSSPGVVAGITVAASVLSLLIGIVLGRHVLRPSSSRGGEASSLIQSN